jgi:hypothetical protein
MYHPTVVAACILVAGCAGTVKEGMANLEGKPLSAVFAKIGQPIGERSIAGKRVIIGVRPSCRLNATEDRNAKSRRQ